MSDDVAMGAEIEAAAEAVLDLCRRRKLRLALAESCTGGLVAGALTEVPGSSDVVDRGFVTYSNRAKMELLGVPAAIIAEEGAVSEPVARAMAVGALRAAGVEVAVGVTGVAGPGGSERKPEGLVHFASAFYDPKSGEGRRLHVMEEFGPLGRSDVRRVSVLRALDLILETLNAERPE